MNEEMKIMEEIENSLNQIEEQEVQEEVVETEQVEEEVVAEAEEAQAEPSEEDQARSQGWVPKEEFRGNPKDWVPAGEYLRRGPIFDYIKDMKKQLEVMANEQRKVAAKLIQAEKSGYERGLKQLQAQRREAIEMGDVEAVEQLDQKIDEVKRAIPNEEAADVPQNELDLARNFIGKYQDAFKDQNVFKFAEMQERLLRASGMYTTPEELFQALENSLIHNPKIGHLFKQQAPQPAPKPKTAPVLGAKPAAAKKPENTVSLDSLGDLAKQQYYVIADSMKMAGKKYSVADYIKDLKDSGAI